jgi:hypothetical protein
MISRPTNLGFCHHARRHHPQPLERDPSGLEAPGCAAQPRGVLECAYVLTDACDGALGLFAGRKRAVLMGSPAYPLHGRYSWPARPRIAQGRYGLQWYGRLADGCLCVLAWRRLRGLRRWVAKGNPPYGLLSWAMRECGRRRVSGVGAVCSPGGDGFRGRGGPASPKSDTGYGYAGYLLTCLAALPISLPLGYRSRCPGIGKQHIRSYHLPPDKSRQ